MTSIKWITAGFVVLVVVPLLSQTPSASPKQSSGGSTSSHKQSETRAVRQTDGERVFEQNCSRCHEAPQGFPPQISGTIVRHMRVRAGLSEKDAQALLRFLNP